MTVLKDEKLHLAITHGQFKDEPFWGIVDKDPKYHDCEVLSAKLEKHYIKKMHI